MILIENANDIIKLLKAQRIKPQNAMRLYCSLRGIPHLEFTDTPHPTAKEVVEQIGILETLENPMNFWQTEQQFSIKNIFNANQLN